MFLDHPLRSTQLGGWNLERNRGPQERVLSCDCCLFPFRLASPAGKDCQASRPEARGQGPAVLSLDSRRLQPWTILPPYELEPRGNHDRDAALCRPSDASSLSWPHPAGSCEAV